MAHGVSTNSERLATHGISVRLFAGFQSHRTPMAMNENRIYSQPILGIKGRFETASLDLLKDMLKQENGLQSLMKKENERYLEICAYYQTNFKPLFTTAG